MSSLQRPDQSMIPKAFEILALILDSGFGFNVGKFEALLSGTRDPEWTRIRLDLQFPTRP